MVEYDEYICDQDTSSIGSHVAMSKSDSPIVNEALLNNSIDTPGEPEPKNRKLSSETINYIQGCRHIDEFKIISKIEEGSYGIVSKAVEKKTNEIVALKKLKMERQTEGFPITSIREIITLLMSTHKNVICVKELVVGHDLSQVYIVMEYMEHDLKLLMSTLRNQEKYFSVGEIKCLLHQLLEGVQNLHDNWIIHRDLKPGNILLGDNGILKIADFGLCRLYGSPLHEYTEIVVTLYYRSPELLLGIRKYSTFVDIWSVGCIFAELFLMHPLWQGKSEIEMMNLIFKDLGTLNTEKYPRLNEDCRYPNKFKLAEQPKVRLHKKFEATISDQGFELMLKMFDYNPHTRISAGQALADKYFNEHPRSITPELFPTWPEKHGKKSEKVLSPPAPKGREMPADQVSNLFFK